MLARFVALARASLRFGRAPGSAANRSISLGAELRDIS